MATARILITGIPWDFGPCYIWKLVLDTRLVGRNYCQICTPLPVLVDIVILVASLSNKNECKE